MTEAHPDQEFGKLLDQRIDGIITPEGEERFNALLENHPVTEAVGLIRLLAMPWSSDSDEPEEEPGELTEEQRHARARRLMEDRHWACHYSAKWEDYVVDEWGDPISSS